MIKLWPWKKSKVKEREQKKEEKIDYTPYDTFMLGTFYENSRFDDGGYSFSNVYGNDIQNMPFGMPSMHSGDCTWIPYGTTEDFRSFIKAEERPDSPVVEVPGLNGNMSRYPTLIITRDGRLFAEKQALKRTYSSTMSKFIEMSFEQLRKNWEID